MLESTVSKQANSTYTPIVAVMGHVDHGKTSLLDAIRGTSVTATEAGGITQNTRAHQIDFEGRKITFIDTPGHEAFSNMRSRGAQVTDIVLLVVAADDGIQPQTKESIKFAQATGTPIIVAINKIDLPVKSLTKLKQELASYNVNIEEYGGDTLLFEVSATEKRGIKELLEGIVLFADIHELKAKQPEAPALGEAFVLESNVHKQLGPVALCLLKAGALDKPYVAASAEQTAKVRGYLDQDQKPLKEVHTSDPFWVMGLKQAVSAGEKILFAADESTAKKLQDKIKEGIAAVKAEEEAKNAGMMLLQKLLNKEATAAGTEQKVLNMVIRASTAGTLEVMKHELEKLTNEQRKIHILDASTSDVSEGDVQRAKASHGIVISFQKKISSKVQDYARQQEVILSNYEIIYEMLEEVGAVLDSLVIPDLEETEVARAKVKQVFTLTKGDMVAGCEVIKGTILKGYKVYVERPSLSTEENVAEIGRGKIASLRILKEEVREAKKGQECGIILDPVVTELQEGDEIVAYKVEK